MAIEEIKSLSFEVLGDGDLNTAGPRLGRLSVKDRKDLETPNFVAVSSRGVVPHITPDVIMASSQIGGVHLALEDCKTRVHHVPVFS
jgi:queuine tRNA-ribosyltransferase subunit QTRTD1